MALHRTAIPLRFIAAGELDVRSLENLLFNRRELLYDSQMSKYSFTEYFENEVLRKRPYLKKEWCQRVVENPIRFEPQEHNRFRFWGEIEELERRYLRVITLADKKTIHNAFPDRGFKP